MANLPEQDDFPEGIYQIEMTDPVLGGPPNLQTKSGLSNIQGQQLANRTSWLKKILDNITNGITAVGNSQKLGGVLAAKFYHADKPNPALRMGTDLAGNFDGLVYDDATNTIVAKADVDIAGTSTGNSRYLAGRLHATSTGNVTDTSTNHPFEIGDFAGGNGLKADFNEILSRSGGVEKSIFWQNVVQTGDFSKDYYETNDGNDTWIVAENFNGDTYLSLLDVNVHRLVIHNFAFFNIRLTLNGFNEPVNTDTTLSFRFDLGAFMVSRGWNLPEIMDSGYAHGLGEFSGAGGDFPLTHWDIRMSNRGSATYPNTLYIASRDRTHLPALGNATDLELTFSFISRIAD